MPYRLFHRVSGIASPIASVSGTTHVQQSGMTRMLVIRSIKFLSPLLTFKDVLGPKKEIKVLRQGPSGSHRHFEPREVAVRVLKLHKQPKPRVMLLTVEDVGMVCEFEILQINSSLFPRFTTFIFCRSTQNPKT